VPFRGYGSLGGIDIAVYPVGNNSLKYSPGELMASFIDLVQAAMRYQRTNMSRRNQQGAVAQNQSGSFDKVLAQSIEGTLLQKAAFQGVLPAMSRTEPQKASFQSTLPVMSRLEVEDELKFRECLNFVLKQEGTKHVVEDGGKESSRYGILQSTAKAHGYKGNIKNISQAEVEAIYRKIWDKSGARDLPLPLSLVHFDSYVNSPASAKKLLTKSGGNLEVYLKSREQRYTRLAEVRPETYGKYLKGWKNRINSLKSAVAEYRKLDSITSART
jgi:hypothetical protein